MASLEQFDLEDFTIVKLKGSLTGEGLWDIDKQFQQATQKPGARVVVDLTGVDMVTTPALALFIESTAVARRSGGKVIFTESSPAVRDVLRRLRLHTVLTTVAGLEEAMKQVRQ